MDFRDLESDSEKKVRINVRVKIRIKVRIQGYGLELGLGLGLGLLLEGELGYNAAEYQILLQILTVTLNNTTRKSMPSILEAA